MGVKQSRPTTTQDLLPSERVFLRRAMHRVGYGRFESLRIEGGEYGA